MDARKIQQVGNRSYAITLPKSWVVRNRLKNQDVVSVFQTDRDELLISKQQQVKVYHQDLSIEIEDTSTLVEFIVFCYMKNVPKVKLRFKDNAFAVSREVQQALQFLEGYEITYENEKELEISSLFQETSVTLPNIIRRILYLLKLQIDTLKKKDIKGLMATEMTIDRLYHLSRKLIFICVKDTAERRKNEIEYEEDLFFMDQLVKKLERISDILLRHHKDSFSSKDVAALQEIMKLLTHILSKKASIKQLKEEYLSLSKRITTQKYVYMVTRILEVSKDALDNVMNIEFNRLMHQNMLSKIQ